MQVYGDSVVIKKQPTISSASTAYAANDVVGSIQTLPCGHGATVTTSDSAAGIGQSGSERNNAPVYLQSITIVEQALQQAGFDIFFFHTAPTVAADNAAFDISDTMMSTRCIGVVNVPSTSYRVAVSNCVASVLNVGLLMQPVASGTVYALPVLRSATTYPLASSLVFQYAFSRDL